MTSALEVAGLQHIPQQNSLSYTTELHSLFSRQIHLSNNRLSLSHTHTPNRPFTYNTHKQKCPLKDIFTHHSIFLSH